MVRILRALLPLAAFGAGGWLLRRAFVAWGEWQVLLALGDPSGAELPETDFWLTLPPALVLLLLGGFLGGRWWRRGAEHGQVGR